MGMCLVGDFRSEEPTDEQMESLFKLSKALMEDLNISVENVKGHSEMKGYDWKPCPVIDMVDLRTKVKEYNEGGELPTFIENPGVPELPKNTTYTVKRGDTLWKIAEEHANISVKELLLLNPGINPRKVKMGTELIIK
jgi:LysM repeat protein